VTKALSSIPRQGGGGCGGEEKETENQNKKEKEQEQRREFQDIVKASDLEKFTI
jgi:hypothetical protein